MAPAPSFERVDGLATVAMRLPFARRELTLLLPADPHALTHTHDTYWAGLWPASLALAQYLFSGTISVPQSNEARVPPILELGCGLGLGAIAAALATGGNVLATDIDPLALKFTRANAERNGCNAQITTGMLDWRAPYPGRHRLIVGADCLYVPDAGAEVARFLATALEVHPDARALIVDPQRHSARNFHYQCREHGLQVAVSSQAAPFATRYGPIGGLDELIAATAVQSGTAVEVTFYSIRHADA